MIDYLLTIKSGKGTTLEKESFQQTMIISADAQDTYGFLVEMMIAVLRVTHP